MAARGIELERSDARFERSLPAEALTHKEVLAKYGLSDAVMEVWELLDQFDAAVKLGSDGRARHTGATKQLRAMALEAGRIVRVMDARNRLRFKHDQLALGAWLNASRVAPRSAVPGSGSEKDPAGNEQGGTPSAGGDVRPAA